MASALDVAQYILAQKGAMTAMKLQKLVYYSQAWSTAWEDDVIFPEPIFAWKNGPVVRELWEAHRGQFRVGDIAGGDPNILTVAQGRTIDIVVNFYGEKNAQWLSDLTHMEDPWKNAWYGVEEHRRGTMEITPASMAEYYSSLGPSDEQA